MKDGVEIRGEDLPIQAAARTGRESHNYEFDLVFDDGTVRHLLGNATPIRGDDGKPRGSVGAFVDITESKRAEVALRESEARYRTLVTGMSAGLILQRADGVVALCNPAAGRILGLTTDQLLGRRSTDPEWRAMREDGTPFPGEEHAPMVALRTGKAQTDSVMALHKPDGTLTWVSINSEPLRDDGGKVYAVLSTFVDITRLKAAEAERNKLQAELAQTARLAAMGTLVAGVAHEINNPLAAELAGQGTALEIVREARRALAERSGPPLEAEIRLLDETVEALSDAQEGGQRVARIVRDLATFASPDPHRSRMRLADVVADAMRWLPATVAKTATVEVEDVGAPEILASRGQIAQVIVNLVTNAAKAARPGTKGKIVVRTGPGDGGTACVEVSDDGAGIGPAVIDRIFDPFFTTRSVGEGRGSGLGLAISRSIVEAHGGTITVRSEVGRGSTFRVELPAADYEAWD
jgi:PAS domain S-box-containing protein